MSNADTPKPKPAARLVRFPKALLAKADAVAADMGMSANALIVEAVDEKLNGPPAPPKGSRLDKKSIGRRMSPKTKNKATPEPEETV